MYIIGNSKITLSNLKHSNAVRVAYCEPPADQKICS